MCMHVYRSEVNARCPLIYSPPYYLRQSFSLNLTPNLCMGSERRSSSFSGQLGIWNTAAHIFSHAASDLSSCFSVCSLFMRTFPSGRTLPSEDPRPMCSFSYPWS